MNSPKYQPLLNELQRRQGPVEMTFSEIASLVGGLPPSAYRLREWWANTSGHVQARAWLTSRRRVATLDLARECVCFE